VTSVPSWKVTPATTLGNWFYPLLIEATGRCPPEDVGGPPGYEEFLAVMADPRHERHTEMLDWYGESFDPETVDPAEIDRVLQKTARSWTRVKEARTT